MKTISHSAAPSIILLVMATNCYDSMLTEKGGIESFEEKETNSIVGVGLIVEKNKDTPPTVKGTIMPSPAQRAGISKDDQIVMVDGVDVCAIELSDLTARLRGQEKTKVEITFQRSGVKKTVLLVREKLTPSSGT